MELYTWSKNGMKMIINSDFKEFNKQTNCISDGNMIANTQYSNYIRNYTVTECNGNKHEKGYLQNFDLKFFSCIPHSLKEYIKNSNKEMILYEFFIYKNHAKDVIGYLLQEDDVITQEYVIGYNLMRLGKRFNALRLCKAIITQDLERYKRRVI